MLGSVKGDQFRKMVMKATGSKKFLSSSTKGHLNKIGASKYLKPGAKVSRKQATKVMKQLKERGAAREVKMSPNQYVSKAFVKEERRQQNIRRQNIADRNKQLSEEKAAEAKSQGKSTAKKAKSSAGGSGAATLSNAVDPTRSQGSNGPAAGFTGSSYGHTNLKPVKDLPKQVEKPQEWIDEENEIIDLAID